MTAATLSPRAARELLVAAEWIADDNPSAANGLIDAVEGAAERIGEHPQIGVRRPELARGHYRFVFLTGYPYLLAYRDNITPPEIIRIVHTARDLPRLLRDLR